MADITFVKTEEILIFLPSWSILNEKDLLDLISCVGNEESHITVANVSVDEDEVPPPYHHDRIKKTILNKQEVMDLLVLYQVPRIPYSIVGSD